MSHDKLLFRLKCYGIGGNLLIWLRNFLKNRTHCTRVGNSVSETCDLLSGVIQGSNVGPLLFISFINELAEILGELYVTAKFFADDLKIFAEVLTNIDIDNLQLALDRLVTWCNDWQMQIAVNKCSMLCIGPIPTTPNLNINDCVLPEVTSVKDLGITFDANLSFSAHITTITISANQRVNLLFRAFHSRNIKTLVKAYITYVRPLLEYNTVIWSPYKTGDISNIEKVQRGFTKRLPGLKNLSYKERLAATNLDTLELRRLRTDLIVCYKIVFGLIKVDSLGQLTSHPLN